MTPLAIIMLRPPWAATHLDRHWSGGQNDKFWLFHIEKNPHNLRKYEGPFKDGHSKYHHGKIAWLRNRYCQFVGSWPSQFGLKMNHGSMDVLCQRHRAGPRDSSVIHDVATASNKNGKNATIPWGSLSSKLAVEHFNSSLQNLARMTSLAITQRRF